MSFLRSLLFSTPLIVLSTVVMWTCSMIASLFDPTGRSQHRMARIWGKLLLAVSFIRVRVEGLEKLDPKANYVFVANHASYMDIPAILARLPHQFRFFAKKGLFSIPFLGWHLHRAGHLPVDRSNARNSLKSMSEGARIVAERGISVLLFPEGGRTREGLRPFKEGAAYIAIKAGRAGSADGHRGDAAAAAHEFHPPARRPRRIAYRRSDPHRRSETARPRSADRTGARGSGGVVGREGAGRVIAPRPYIHFKL